jgi:NADPH:quinone reductase-like Zn-dependent oxidoreductase
MKAIYIARHGGPEVLELRSTPDPEPGAGEIRVRVKAAGVNFADIMMRMGMYPGAPAVPFVPGYEAAGVVDAIGPGLPRGLALKDGDRVVVPCNYGGYSDTLIAKATDVFPIPAGKSFEEAAALTVNYLTAYLALVEQGNIQEGRRVLIHGAAGGVGIAAAQIAKIYGATVFGTASASKHAAARKEGVDHPIDYRTEDFEEVVARVTGGRGVHIALDPIGGAHFAKSYRSLAIGGKMIVYGFSAGATGKSRQVLSLLWHWLRTPSFSPFDMMTSNRGVIGLHLGRMTGETEVLKAAMIKLAGWWAEGRIRPVIGATFPFEEAAKAHAFIQDRGNTGKVVLVIS